jgi:heterodisulfide reductase subunit C
VTKLSQSEWKDGFQPNKKGGLICYTHGSKTNKGTRTGVCGYGTRWKLSCIPGQYTTVFQACAVENLDRNYRNRNIYILSDSEAASKALDNYQIDSKLVWNCHFQSKCKEICVTCAENDSVTIVRRRVRMKPYNATLPNPWIGRTVAVDEVASSLS